MIAIGCAPAVGYGQSSGDEASSEASSESASEEADSESSRSDSNGSGDERDGSKETGDSASDSKDSEGDKDGSTEKSSKSETASKETGDSASDSKGSDDGSETKKGQQASEASGDSSSSEPEKGPGGRKMRSDYPGTDEAMKSQMESDRIEGLKFKQKGGPSQAYDLKLKELQTKIDDLKEQVFQSKSRILSLKETVLGGSMSGSRAVIMHAKGLGTRFELKRALYSLDGNRIFDESADKGGISEEKELKLYDGSITAGSHNVSILLEYQGSGFGIFNYMKSYKIRITSSCQFRAENGKSTILRVRVVTDGPAFARNQEPEIRCKITKTDLADQMDQGQQSLTSSPSQNGEGSQIGEGSQSGETSQSSGASSSGGGDT